jgi:hypothetical protein
MWMLTPRAVAVAVAQMGFILDEVDEALTEPILGNRYGPSSRDDVAWPFVSGGSL